MAKPTAGPPGASAPPSVATTTPMKPEPGPIHEATSAYGDGCLIRDRLTQTSADNRPWVYNECLALTGVALRASFDRWGWSPPKPPEQADDSYRKRGTVGFDRSSEGGILLPKRAASDPASAYCRMRTRERD